MSAILIKNGHLVDPANQKDEVCDRKWGQL